MFFDLYIIKIKTLINVNAQYKVMHLISRLEFIIKVKNWDSDNHSPKTY